MKKVDNIANIIEIHAPSNIAFVKYWGKTGRQYPLNPSISMTLNTCKTMTTLDYSWGANSLTLGQTIFEGKEAPEFHDRLNKFLHSIIDLYPELAELKLNIKSENTFPHSAGIASSASSFGAIGLGLSRILKEVRGEEFNLEKEASKISRLGSGSAARSIQGPFVRWGVDSVGDGSNEFAEVVSDYNSVFNELNDCILLVDLNEKKVSSSAGHTLMDNHFYKLGRLAQANRHFDDLLAILRTGDLEAFGKILETEALSLHGLMMSSNPPYVLLKPNSLAIISKILEFRENTKTPVYFTIDAGPNIHLIYPKSVKEQVESFIESELKNLCCNGKYILDYAGTGAKII